MLRSLLFVPGNSPKMMIDCGYFGADAVIFDLEDAVSPDEKDAARLLVSNALGGLRLGNSRAIVRINSMDTPLWEEDLCLVAKGAPMAILLPKADSADKIITLSKRLAQLEGEHGLKPDSILIIALLETALGIENAYSIATASKRMLALFLGAEDLTGDLGCRRTKQGNEIAYARGRVVMAAKAAGIMAIDTPFTDVFDSEGAALDSRLARGLGFNGKSAISPHHIAIINKEFSPTQAEVDYANAVLWAIEEGRRMGKGAVALNGKMIDAPVVSRAQQVLSIAKAIVDMGGELS